jgi:hypothetical protein
VGHIRRSVEGDGNVDSYWFNVYSSFGRGVISSNLPFTVGVTANNALAASTNIYFSITYTV